MIIVKIQAGLGNQMFQYAYAKALSKQGFKVKIDSSAYVKNKPHSGYGLADYAITLPDLYPVRSYQTNLLTKIGLEWVRFKRKNSSQFASKI